MTDAPLRRTAMVATGYVIVAWVVLGIADWLRRVLALPELFDTLLRGGMVAGLPVAILLAWNYPSLGHGDGRRGADDPEGPSGAHGPPGSPGAHGPPGGDALTGPDDGAARP